MFLLKSDFLQSETNHQQAIGDASEYRLNKHNEVVSIIKHVNSTTGTLILGNLLNKRNICRHKKTTRNRELNIYIEMRNEGKACRKLQEIALNMRAWRMFDVGMHFIDG